MGDNVFTNKRGAFHKGSAGKSMGAMPDVCIPPPPPPAPPVPTPFPNNATAADLTGCAPSVEIHGNPAAHQKSYVSKSTGNEPADMKASGQAAVVTHVIEGAAYFHSYSMDVLFEGIEAVRHLDLTTHNHSSQALGSTPPSPMISSVDFSKPWSVNCGPGCELTNYQKPNKCPVDPGTKMQKTPHHIIPEHCFHGLSTGGFQPNWPEYKPNRAACICVTGGTKSEKHPVTNKLLEHGRIHAALDVAEGVAGLRNNDANQWSFEEAKATGIAAVNKTLGNRCDPACVAAVIDATHEGDREKPLRAHCPKTKQAAGRRDAIAVRDRLSISPAQVIGR